MNSTDDRPTDLDAVLRHVHEDALSHVSAATRAQLHQRRRAAFAGPARTWHGVRRGAWPFAAAAAALLAVVAGVQLRPAGLQGDPAPSPIATTTAPADAAAPTLALDENPDFYAWLASNEAVMLASE